MIEIDKILAAQRTWRAATPARDAIIRNMANESLTKCADAVAVLSSNLRDIGSPWAHTEQIPLDALKRNVSTIEKTIGFPIPEVLFWSGPERPIAAPAGGPDFLSYLRTTILECAGFPAFLGLPAFDPIGERLLQGVPIF